MERDFAGARLSRESFRTLAGMCKGDRRFPASYEDWETLVREGTRQALADGRPIDDFSIGTDEFFAWCQKLAIRPCFDALRAYLILGHRGVALAEEQRQEQGGAQPAGDRAQGNDDGRARRTRLLGAGLQPIIGMVRPQARPCSTEPLHAASGRLALVF
ncbi:hypothetical protein [Ideonella sp.]|uniref:hypothetical protein n=1 Tax=Ideonella sp. TaxID=1929293 RepID=UPI002B49EA10|nr:hypothetical protein [Ideonella sp.]HJV70563.1 hypothetical protein [Ideonella sp.]